jgi:hypothetical protein
VHISVLDLDMSSKDEELPDADSRALRRYSKTHSVRLFRAAGREVLADLASFRATGTTATAPLPGVNHAGGSSLNSPGPPQPAVTLVHDSQDWLSVIRNLNPSDVLVLLTPLVAPIEPVQGEPLDPFECFGQALQVHHNKVRHIPYTTRNGITSTHVGMIKRATVVVFVISDAPRIEQSPQIHAALVTRKALRDERPLLVILTCQPHNLAEFAEDFPTIIQSRDYSRATLEITASFIFGRDGSSSLPPTSRTLSAQPPAKPWPVEVWNEARDLDSVYDLWTQSMDVHFAMPVTTLAGLLRRPGYARHYVVRDDSGQLLGFCATFFLYVDQEGEKLIGSLAILMVNMARQCEGIGLSLHDHAIEELQKIRGVCRLQLGSTFPRILQGPPLYMEFNQTWFTKRGWRFDRRQPGQGQPVYDMRLDFREWRIPAQLPGIMFRTCANADMGPVLQLVQGEVEREHKMGWFDQYSKLVGDPNVKDIVIALEGNVVIGVALTYTPMCCSPISFDLPWAGLVGDDVGGVTCICIPPARRSTLMIPLLSACVEKLRLQNMKEMFIDGVPSDVQVLDGYKSLGMLIKIHFERIH